MQPDFVPVKVPDSDRLAARGAPAVHDCR
eukprot:COSAG02_NODE_60100_length_272_cov_0.601156_1_plen_28_part_10